MSSILSLSLPNVLPHPNAIKSWGENTHYYEPEFWEFQYDTYRYLGRLGDVELLARYDSITRNMQAIISDDRHVIPIRSFLSSWYWYRKEHQTRYEFTLRKLRLDRELPAFNQKLLGSAPARPRSPNAGDVLFRYGSEKWLRELIQFGRLRLTAARDYDQLESDLARRDDELAKHSFIPGKYTKVTTEDGGEIPIIGDIKQSVGGADYFVYCVSCDWDAHLFDDFNVDCCVVIRNVDEFSRRLQIAAEAELDGWYFHHCPISYFDPTKLDLKKGLIMRCRKTSGSHIKESTDFC